MRVRSGVAVAGQAKLAVARIGAKLRRVARLLNVLVVAGAVATGTSGCSLDGGWQKSREQKVNENLQLQRKVAVKLRESYSNPELETIRYTTDGDRAGGLAGWSANAVVTIAGRDYLAALGTIVNVGQVFPPAPSGSVPGDVTLIYSDGTSEVLK